MNPGDVVGAAVRAGPPVAVPETVRATLQIFWESPFPASLPDAGFRIIDVHEAFCEFTGYGREALGGGVFGSRISGHEFF